MTGCHITLVLAVLAPWLQGPSARAQGPATGTVTIVLAAEAVIDDSLITLEQIATLKGGADSLRRRLAKIDIAEFRLGATHAVVLSEQVGFRLLLAWSDSNRFALRGARRPIVMDGEEPATFGLIV